MERRRGTLRGLQIEWGVELRGGGGGWYPARKGIWPLGEGCVRWGGGPGGYNEEKWREERAGRGSEQETVESPASGEGKDGWELERWDAGRPRHRGSAGRGWRAGSGGVRGPRNAGNRGWRRPRGGSSRGEQREVGVLGRPGPEQGASQHDKGVCVGLCARAKAPSG